MKRTILIVILLLSLISGADAGGTGIHPGGRDPSPPGVTLDVRALPLSEVLAQIAEQAGIVIYVVGDIGHYPVTARFENSDPAWVLKGVLRGQSYAVRYSGGGSAGGVFALHAPGFSATRNFLGGTGNTALRDFQDASSVLDALIAESGGDEQGNAGMIQDREGIGSNEAGARPAPQAAFLEEKNAEVTGSGPRLSEAVKGSVPEGIPEEGDGRESPWAGNASTGIADDAGNLLESQIERLERRIASGISDFEYEKWVAVKGEKYVIHDRERLEYYRKKLNAL